MKVGKQSRKEKNRAEEKSFCIVPALLSWEKKNERRRKEGKQKKLLLLFLIVPKIIRLSFEGWKTEQDGEEKSFCIVPAMLSWEKKNEKKKGEKTRNFCCWLLCRK